ncbi:hypothetical protein C8Q75DRAFT_731541 [Abortiporus biennis]|nr:hypothetical protein C8Q75DRAFT_731541 [Abortiporus biennis]
MSRLQFNQPHWFVLSDTGLYSADYMRGICQCVAAYCTQDGMQGFILAFKSNQFASVKYIFQRASTTSYFYTNRKPEPPLLITNSLCLYSPFFYYFPARWQFDTEADMTYTVEVVLANMQYTYRAMLMSITNLRDVSLRPLKAAEKSLVG